ncbi:ROK family transcriptional regulator [Agromyces protaetiae]|uniref:ROK family transcriptional regulator n=1 Tax=Agromyces protaetiae TaxID=2509455 RepID=A0A4P6FEM6_9MICO|nr:ROK family transcriptional regulator [Agromyces protaetiae]QAY74730.1 ROK family transcriptional regulator [Agromyces protaetiae]
MSQIDPGTPTWLRTHNDRTAFRLLLEHGPLTRTQLGELSGMSKPTAAQMISRLERVDLIHAVGEVSGGRGPNAVSYGVRTDRIVGVAVSILADGSHAVVVDAADAEHPIVAVPHEPSGRTPEDDVRRAVRAASEAAGVDPANVSHVVVGVQAAVFAERDALSLTDTLPGWPATGARGRIEEALGLQVVLENDVNLAAIAERAVGIAADVSSFAEFWIGDGLGVALDFDGVVHRGASGGAGEIGYLEASRSAIRLVPEARDFTDLLGGPVVADLLGARDGEGLADVLPRLAGDEAALDAIAERVAITIGPVVAVVDPALVVLAGPTSLAGGEALAARVAERIDRSAHPTLAVRVSGTGDQPVLLGARRLLVDRIRDLLEADITTAA